MSKGQVFFMCLICAVTGLVVGSSITKVVCKNVMRSQAVKAGAATWTADENGDAKFIWITK